MNVQQIAPGTCADCGNDAYIRLAGGDESVCAHCFAERVKSHLLRPPRVKRPAPPQKRARRSAA